MTRDQQDRMLAEAFALSGFPGLDEGQAAVEAGEMAGTMLRVLESVTRALISTMVSEGVPEAAALAKVISALTATASVLSLPPSGQPIPRIANFARCYWKLHETAQQRGSA